MLLSVFPSSLNYATNASVLLYLMDTLPALMCNHNDMIILRVRLSNALAPATPGQE